MMTDNGKMIDNGKMALVRASMVVTYYIKFFHTGADRYNDTLISQRQKRGFYDLKH